MSGLNVRNLISRFEQLTSGFEKSAPKTPLTPKVTDNKAFFPETKHVQNNSSNVKLLKIEQQVYEVKKQVRIIEEVSNDDFVKILFSLLNLLIDLSAIEVEGNFNVKQKKNQCFRDIIECKDELVQSLDEDFAVQNGITGTNTRNAVSERSSFHIRNNDDEEEIGTEERVFSNINYEEEREDVVGVDPKLFTGVSRMTEIFENKSKSSEYIPKPANYFNKGNEAQKKEEVIEAKTTEEKNPRTSTTSENSVSSEDSVETVISNENNLQDEETFESSAEITLNSVKKLRDMYEAKSTEDITKPRPPTTLNKLIKELEHEEEYVVQDYKKEIGNKEKLGDTEASKNNEKEAVSIEKQRKLMETLSAELDYYESLISSMDPDDDVRAEVLEENLVEMFLEINKFETCGDALLESQKADAINSAQLLQTRINEKKTNIGNYFNNFQEPENARRKSQLPPAGDFEAILIEVERYKDLVSKFDPADGEANGSFLEENICEVLLLLDNYQPDDEEERNKKMRAIKDLGLILEELTSKKETKDEKHLIAVCPQSPHRDQNELINDEHFRNYIAVCPPAPDNYKPTNQNINDANIETSKENQIDISLKSTKDDFKQNSTTDQKADQLNSTTPETTQLIHTDTPVTDDGENFDEEFEALVNENLSSEHAKAAATRLRDICGEVNIFQNILRELQIFDQEELEIFKKNVAELEDVLINLQCGGDADLESTRMQTLAAVRKIQETLESFKA